jgi:hypothetical protein
MPMRLTVTLNPEVENLLRKQRAEPFRPTTFDMGKPLVDLTKEASLASDLEDEKLIRKHRRGR